MNPETSEQVRVFRSVIAAERASIEDLERRFEHHTMKRMAQRAMADLDDVEMFLKPMEAQGRTLLECNGSRSSPASFSRYSPVRSSHSSRTVSAARAQGAGAAGIGYRSE